MRGKSNYGEGARHGLGAVGGQTAPKLGSVMLLRGEFGHGDVQGATAVLWGTRGMSPSIRAQGLGHGELGAPVPRGAKPPLVLGPGWK